MNNERRCISIIIVGSVSRTHSLTERWFAWKRDRIIPKAAIEWMPGSGERHNTRSARPERSNNNEHIIMNESLNLTWLFDWEWHTKTERDLNEEKSAAAAALKKKNPIRKTFFFSWFLCCLCFSSSKDLCSFIYDLFCFLFLCLLLTFLARARSTQARKTQLV